MKDIIKSKKFFGFIEKNIILLGGFFLTLPFIFISYFNHPSGDDYCYAVKSNQLGFWAAQLDWYNTWSGRYTANFFLSLDIIGSHNFYWYKLFPVILIVGLFFALYLLVKVFFNSQSIAFCLRITMLVFLIYLAQLPIVSEGFYWWASAISYQLANILTIILLRNLIVASNKVNYINTIVNSLLAFVLVGLNETSMLLVTILLTSIVGLDFYQKRKINKLFLVVFLVGFLGSLIVYLAPGNSVRSSRLVGSNNLIFSLGAATVQSILSLVIWGGMVVLTAFLISMEISKKQLNVYFTSRIPIKYQFVVFLSLIFSGFFIGFWASGMTIPPRTRNVVYLFFVIGVIYFLTLFFREVTFFKNNILSIPKVRFFIALCVLSIFFSQQNFINVFKDLGKRKAQLFNEEMNKRKQHVIIEEGKAKDLIFKSIVNPPESIFTSDLKTDVDHFYNSCYSKYWNINSVTTTCKVD